MGAIPGSMGPSRESRGALRGGEGRPGELLGSVVIRAGEIKTAPGLRAEQLALPLLQTPAAIGAGAHHLGRRGVAEGSVVALGIGERLHGDRVGGPARIVKMMPPLQGETTARASWSKSTWKASTLSRARAIRKSVRSSPAIAAALSWE